MKAHRELFRDRLRPFDAAEPFELFSELAEELSDAAALNWGLITTLYALAAVIQNRRLRPAEGVLA